MGKYSLERIKYPEGSAIVSCYVVVDKQGNHCSDGDSRAIYVDNHFIIMGNYSQKKQHDIKKVYCEDTNIKIIDKKVRSLARKELENLVKHEKELEKAGPID